MKCNKPFSHQLKYSLTHIPISLGGDSHFLCFRVYPQMADIWGSFLASLVAAETEAAAADLWRVAVEKGVVQPKAIPQHVSTLRGAAGYLWMTQGAQAVKGQHDQAAAQQELLNRIRKLVSCLSQQAPQQCAQAAAVPHKKSLPPADSVPVRPLDEHFLLRHTAYEWVIHFSSVLSEYDATENEAKLILLRKV